MSKKDFDIPEKMSFWSRLYAKLDIPPDIINGIFVELRGRTNVCIHGCREILLYTPEEVKFRLKGCVLSVRGKGLYCTAYHAGSAEIDGVINSVGFDECEEKK